MERRNSRKEKYDSGFFFQIACLLPYSISGPFVRWRKYRYQPGRSRGFDGDVFVGTKLNIRNPMFIPGVMIVICAVAESGRLR